MTGPLTPGAPARPLVYRAELVRRGSGTWDLYWDGALAASTGDKCRDCAFDWASLTLGFSDLAWVNALDVPDPESGCWLADPGPETARGRPFRFALTALLAVLAAFTSCALASAFGWHPAITRPATGITALLLIACAVRLNRSAS